MKMPVSPGPGRKSFSGTETEDGKQATRSKSLFSGFSLLESLISLSLSLFILISALEVMTQAKRIYSRSQSEQETALGAAVALEKFARTSSKPVLDLTATGQRQTAGR